LKITPGKYMGLKRISTSTGCFQMMALDQRNSLKRMLKKFKEPRGEDLIAVKRSILKNLSEYVSAVLVDPEYGFFENLKYIHRNSGVILSLEKSGYVEKEGGRISQVVEDDIVKKAKKWGVDAVKLLIYWSDNVSEEVKNHQRDLVKKMGEMALESDILYILEILTYGVSESEKTKAVLSALKEFSRDDYHVDLFKVEPVVREESHGLSRDYIFDVTGGKPWVILSGGMDVETFKKIVEMNCELGASGVLAGRVIWKDSVRYVDDPDRMDLFLKTTGVRNVEIIRRAMSLALPYHQTPYYKDIMIS